MDELTDTVVASSALQRRDDELSRALALGLERCLGLRADEDLLVLAEHGCGALAERVRAEAELLGARASVLLAPLRERFEPPPSVAAALAACDAFFALTDGSSISHTAARATACAAGVRGVGVAGGDGAAELLARLLGADLDAVVARGRRIAELLEGASTASIRCPRGTHLVLELRGPRAVAEDGDFRAPGAYGNLPFGEAFVVPTGGEGRLVPTTVAGVGHVAPDTVLEIGDGALTEAAGADGLALAARLQAHGAAGVNVAELGVGTNERAGLSGSVLEDEKALGSIHVAFGASVAIGGVVAAPVHVDCVVPDATLLLDGETVVRDGRLLIDAAAG